MDENQNTEKEKTLTIKKSDIWKYSTFVLVIAVIVIAVVAFTNPEATGNTVNTQQPNNAPAVTASQKSADDDPILGDKNAKVTIIEFSDYQCPFCRRFWTDTLPQIKAQYIDTGKARLVYRDYPIPSLGHEMAVTLAEAAECARDVGGSDEAYFEMHDKIYEEQNVLDSGSPEGPVTKTVHGFTEKDVKSWAQEIGYDIDECMASDKFISEIQKDLADGGQLGTPSFFVNGQKISGAQPFSVFQQAIESEL